MSQAVRVCEAEVGAEMACDSGRARHSVPPSAPGARHPECGSRGDGSPEIKMGWGGRRPGAGRKPKAPQVVRPPVCMLPRWGCVETVPRRELQALVTIGRLRLETYLPTYLPLAPGAVMELAFPGYVFVRFSLVDPAWRRIHECEGVLRLLSCEAERPMVVPDAEIARIRKEFDPETATARAARDARRPAVPVGATVTICLGPFAGYKGIVQAASPHRVVVELDVLGGRPPVSLPAAAVRL